MRIGDYCVKVNGVAVECARAAQVMEEFKVQYLQNSMYNLSNNCVDSCYSNKHYLKHDQVTCVKDCQNAVAKQAGEYVCQSSGSCPDADQLYANVSIPDLGAPGRVCLDCASCQDCVEAPGLDYTQGRECVSECSGGHYLEDKVNCVQQCATNLTYLSYCVDDCAQYSTNGTYKIITNEATGVQTRQCANCSLAAQDGLCVDSCKSAGLYLQQSICVEKCAGPTPYHDANATEQFCAARCGSGYADDATKRCVAAGDCPSYDAATADPRLCRGCRDAEIFVVSETPGEPAQCRGSCPDERRYYDKALQTCNETCRAYYTQYAGAQGATVSQCADACPYKLYRANADDAQRLCVAACEAAEIQIADAAGGHRRCAAGCPDEQPYYIVADLSCVAACAALRPYYDPVGRRCVAQCAGAAPHLPEPGSGSAACTDCASGYVFSNETDGYTYCYKICPAGYTGSSRGRCELNRGAAEGWWVWLLVALAVAVVIIAIALTVVCCRRRRRAQQAKAAAGDAQSTAYYAQKASRAAGAQYGRVARPQRDAGASQTERASARTSVTRDAPGGRRGLAPAGRTQRLSAAGRSFARGPRRIE